MLRIPALLSAQEVRECRQAMEAADWQDGRLTAGHLAAQVKSNWQLPVDSPLAAQMGNLDFGQAGAQPAVFIGSAAPAGAAPRFNRYEGGGTYGNHIDNALFVIPGTAIKVRTDAPPPCSQRA